MNPMIKFYYQIRPLVPRRVQLCLRRSLMCRQRLFYRNVWPIDPRAACIRAPWTAWPDGKRFALVLTHDVENAAGLENVSRIMAMEKELGFHSSFNFVAERYPLPSVLREALKSGGFEIGVHGLLHDGKLYSSRQTFMERAARINLYLKQWDATGFRSPSMQHNLEWLHCLDILYDASTFDTDPFEPDHSGVCTVFPFWVPGKENGSGYVELPYTLPQDSTLYVFLKERTIDIWKKKTDWLVQQGGMVLVNTHPDYMNFPPEKSCCQTYPADFYRQFLEYIRSKYEGVYWHALPHEMARFVSGGQRQAG